MSDQNDGTQGEHKGVKFPPQGSSEGSPPVGSNPVDRWIKKRAEEGAKRPNPLLDLNRRGDA